MKEILAIFEISTWDLHENHSFEWFYEYNRKIFNFSRGWGLVYFLRNMGVWASTLGTDKQPHMLPWTCDEQGASEMKMSEVKVLYLKALI